MTNEKLSLIHLLTNNPKKISLFDASGALLSTLLLLVISKLETYIGMPTKIIYPLSAFTFCLFIFSFFNYWIMKTNWKTYLNLIIFGNCTYVIISTVLLSTHFNQLTTLGIVYFILEIVIIIFIILLEYKAYLHQKKLPII